MPSPVLFVLGAKYEQIPLMTAARRAGLATLGIDYHEDPPGRRHCDHYHPVSYRDEDAIADIAGRHQVAGIGTIGTNDAICVAARLNRRLGLPGRYDPPAIVERATYKDRWREPLRAHGVPVPAAEICADADAAAVAAERLGWPVIVKPTDASGSKGVRVVAEAPALPAAVAEARRCSTAGQFLVEQYIGHNSYAVESFVVAGCAHLLAIGTRTLPPSPGCVGLGVTTPDDLAPAVRTAVAAASEAAIAALELGDGPVHIDMAVDPDGQPHIIDIGPRLVAGPFGWAHIELSTGFDAVGAVLGQALGEARPSIAINPTGRYFAHRYLTVPRAGVLRAVNIDPVLLARHQILDHRITTEIGAHLRPIEDAGQRYGYVTAWGTSFADVTTRIQGFVDQAVFDLEPAGGTP